MKCNYCEWRCDLSHGSVCGNYKEQDGLIVQSKPFVWSRIQPNSAERIPIFHFIPNGRFLQLGGFSCNAACAYCINAALAIKPDEGQPAFSMNAKQVVSMAKRGEYDGIHFGINEIAVNLPCALEIAKAARAEGLYVGCSTNGYLTGEAAESVSRNFDFLNISLKALDSDFYRKELRLNSVEPVLRNIRYFAAHNHLEITTPIVAGMGEREIMGIADFIAAINRDIPWHVFRVLPEHEMADNAPPDINEVTPLIMEAKKKLNYVYWGNFIGSKWLDTHCPQCGELLVKRLCEGSCGARFLEQKTQGGKCSCGYQLPLFGF